MRELLKKYMHHILSYEGSTFVNIKSYEVKFTEEELSILQEIESEIESQLNEEISVTYENNKDSHINMLRSFEEELIYRS